MKGWRTARSRASSAVRRGPAESTTTTRCERSRRLSVAVRDCTDSVMRDLLPVYAAGRLGAEQHAAVEGHLAACAECRAELELIRAVIRAYAVPVPDAAVIAAHIRPRRRVTGSVPFHRQPLWRVAATATLMIAASATYVAVRSGGGGPRAIPDSAARLVAGVDASRPDTGATP